MKIKSLSAVLSMLLIGLMSMSMIGCGNNKKPAVSTSTPAATPVATPAESTAPVNKDVALTLWGAADDQTMLGEMVESFKAENPDVNWNITLRVVGEDVAKEEVLKDLDATADVFAIPHDQLGALVEADVVYKNTKYADEIKANAISGAITAAMYGGEMYGYPSSAETYFLYYDKRVFAEEDVKSLDTMLAKDLGAGIAPLGFDMGNAYFSGAFFLTNGCELFGPNGDNPDSVTFNNAQGLEVANYLSGLKAQGVIAIDDGTAATQFQAGKLGAQVTGAWKAEAYKEVLGDNYGVAELPTINFGSGDQHMKSFAGFKLYCVKANTAFPLEAMSLAAYLTNSDNQLKRFTDRNFLPVNTAVAENPTVTADITIAATVAQLPYAIAMPSIPQMGQFWTPTAAFTKDTFDGVIVAADLQAKLDNLVKDITVK